MEDAMANWRDVAPKTNKQQRGPSSGSALIVVYNNYLTLIGYLGHVEELL